jgi:hypothetical protein
MNLLKDIKDGKYNLELLFVIIVLFLYFYCKKSNTKPTVEPTIEPTIEPMSGGDVVSNELKTAIIKEIKSQFDIDSIKNLSLIASNLINNNNIKIIPCKATIRDIKVGLSSDKESTIVLGNHYGKPIYIKNIEPEPESEPSFNIVFKDNTNENNTAEYNILKIDNGWSIETDSSNLYFKNNDATQFTIEKNSTISSVNDIKTEIDGKTGDRNHNHDTLYSPVTHYHNYTEYYTNRSRHAKPWPQKGYRYEHSNNNRTREFAPQ